MMFDELSVRGTTAVVRVEACSLHERWVVFMVVVEVLRCLGSV